MADEPKFLDAVGIAVGAHLTGDQKAAAHREELMRAELEKAQAEGITDDTELRYRMMSALNKIKYEIPE
jgi:hypothetical protein